MKPMSRKLGTYSRFNAARDFCQNVKLPLDIGRESNDRVFQPFFVFHLKYTVPPDDTKVSVSRSENKYRQHFMD